MAEKRDSESRENEAGTEDGSGVLVVLSTFPSADQARQIGTVLVDRQLAACVNVIPGVVSIYRWEGQVRTDEEVLAVIKTSRATYPVLEEALIELHPYDEPEVIALPVAAGSGSYLAWVAGSCAAEEGGPAE